MTTTIVLTSGTSWTTPADWNSSNNSIEAIGAGLNGGAGNNASVGGTGGKGGCYAKITNFSGTGTISYQIGAANGTVGAGTAPTANTWFANASTLVAAGGDTATTNCVGSTVYAGGGGGASAIGGGGGGGAGGSHAAGASGTAGSSYTAGTGGQGDGTFGGAGGGGAGNGSNGTEWGSVGSGGGGGGGAGGATVNGQAGGAGGQYGAGGGGGGGCPSSYTGGSGGPASGGVIVITYVSTAIAVVLTSGTSWTVPANWNNASNKIMALGAGAHGGSFSGAENPGGGGGAYAEVDNLALTIGANITYQIGVANGTTGSGTAPTANTWFRDGSTVVAAGGATPTSGTASGVGGTVANSVGTIKYAGGNGGPGGTANIDGGGGGAAGPNGAGGNGPSATATSGAGDAGFGGAAVTTSTATPVNGNPGTEWPGGVGSGSGSSGLGTSGTNNTSTAGLYGAGGGGAHVNNTPGHGTGGLIVIQYAPAGPPPAPILFYPVDQPPQLRAPAFPIINPAMRTSFGISIAGPLFLPPPPAMTPSAWFDMAQATSRPSFPGQTLSDVGRLQAAMASRMVVGLLPPVYVPPPIPGRLALPQFYFVPLDEIVLNINLLINGVNANFLALGVDPHLLIPTFAFIGADELTESVNALITAANNQFHNQGLSAAQDIRLFYGLEPSEATLALNTLADELTANLVQVFGS